MILGVGAPRFVYAAGSVDFTETGFYVMKKKEPVAKDIIRDSQITSDRKFIEVGVYLEFQYVFYNKSKAEIDSLKTMFGKEITFIPHSDAGIAFMALCTEARAEMSDGSALKYRLYISVISKNYFSYGSMISMTSPIVPVTWVRNYEFLVSWNFYGISDTENVQIDLYWNDIYQSTIVTTTVGNPGHYDYTIPVELATGTGYKIRVSLLSNLYMYAETAEIQIDSEYWTDENGDFVLDENGDPIPMN